MHPGTGGVFIFGLKLADAVGAAIILTSSSDAKLAKAQTLVKMSRFVSINYTDDRKLEEVALATTNGPGVEVILRTVAHRP
jgi:NADPH:quinone reductase-like Zn-dependent oxidoreductase